MITASVLGRKAGEYVFTSALPLQVLKMLAPEIDARLARSGASPVRAVTTAVNAGG